MAMVIAGGCSVVTATSTSRYRRWPSNLFARFLTTVRTALAGGDVILLVILA